MGTNYYARIIPTKERKKELHDAIEADDFPLINRLTREMYSSIERNLDAYWDAVELIGGVVHLGKASSGWKFLWDPNIFVLRNGHMEDVNGIRKYIPDPNTALYTYPLTKKGLKTFIDREDVLIYDEYDKLQNKEEFWKMALEWGYDKDNIGWDSASYEAWEEKNNKNYRTYPITGELTDLLRSEGYKFTSSSHSDFYSDGLRFAGFIDFS